MANPVNVSDLEARFRSLTAEEETVAQALLDDAWAILLATVPDLDNRMLSGSVATEVVVFAVTSMVLRVLRNPNGVRSWSVDDYSETRDNSLSAGALYASEAEVRLLTGLASTARRGAFSVVPHQEPPCTPGSEADFIEYLHYGRRW